MSKAKLKAEEQQQAISDLKEVLKPGDTLHTILRHTSRSGLQRVVDVVVVIGGDIHSISSDVAKALDWKLDRRHWGIVVGGVGMDVGWEVVYNLGRVLWPDGFGCIGDRLERRCPSNDHFNGDRDYRIHEVGAGGVLLHNHWHASGGYALRRMWV